KARPASVDRCFIRLFNDLVQSDLFCCRALRFRYPPVLMTLPDSSRRILVTSALPYANGHIHLGHLVEYLQTDIWVRFQKSRGVRAVYVCADDTHGTAIMMRAQKEGRSETDLIAEMKRHHEQDFRDFGIE